LHLKAILRYNCIQKIFQNEVGKQMSFTNNRQTLEPYIGKVWLTRPRPSNTDQYINVCVEHEGDFVALDQLTLAPDGVYRTRKKTIGKIDDDSFRQYIDKLTGTPGMGEQELFDRVCESYEVHESFGPVAREVGISKERVRRILITRGKLTSKLIEEIAFLYDGGKGSSVADIAKMLKVSEDVVQKNMAYTDSHK